MRGEERTGEINRAISKNARGEERTGVHEKQRETLGYLDEKPLTGILARDGLEEKLRWWVIRLHTHLPA